MSRMPPCHCGTTLGSPCPRHKRITLHLERANAPHSAQDANLTVDSPGQAHGHPAPATVDVGAIRAEHESTNVAWLAAPRYEHERLECDLDGEPWPCPTTRLCDALEAERARVAELDETGGDCEFHASTIDALSFRIDVLMEQRAKCCAERDVALARVAELEAGLYDWQQAVQVEGWGKTPRCRGCGASSLFTGDHPCAMPDHAPGCWVAALLAASRGGSGAGG